jgi:hypothetical protein
MSEFQYYEFQAIDRPLTEEQQRAVAELSSRVEPHPRRAVFTYSFGGGLRRNPEDLVAEYYDAMLYLDNWGSRQLMFRFPKRLVDIGRMQQYEVVTHEYASDAVDVYTRGKYAILNIQLHEEGGLGWIGGEGWLDSLVSLRDAVLRQDCRLLYLAWLKGVTLEYDVDEEAREPPVPPGLQTLSLALENFVELFDLDEDLIQVAAASSGELQKGVSGDDLQGAIAKLTPEERDRFLLRLAKGEPHLTLALNRRLSALAGLDASQSDAAARRTVGELFAEAEARRERRIQEQKARAEAKRIAELEALAGREEKAWREVDALIQRGQAKPYDEAVELLKKLRDLASLQRSAPVFEGHMRQLCELYGRRPALMSRLRQAKLVPVDE